MDNKPYKTVAHGAAAEYVEKRSRFIATVSPVDDDDRAREFVAAVKKKYPDARHNVYAYLTLDGMTRYSDDGEPKGTAGLPVLGVLQKQELYGVAVVVTRYFGGVLLGAAGLLRAYTKAAADGVEAAGVVTVRPYSRINVNVSFSDAERVRYELSKHGLPEYDVDYSESVTFRLLVPEERTDHLIARRLFDKLRRGVLADLHQSPLQKIPVGRVVDMIYGALAVRYQPHRHLNALLHRRDVPVLGHDAIHLANDDRFDQSGDVFKVIVKGIPVDPTFIDDVLDCDFIELPFVEQPQYRFHDGVSLFGNHAVVS